jgi:hypothetical protein
MPYWPPPFLFRYSLFLFHDALAKTSNMLLNKSEKVSWAPVDHACNPSNSGGRDQEDHSSKPAQANSSTRSYLKKSHHKKRVGGLAQGVGPEFKPQY